MKGGKNLYDPILWTIDNEIDPSKFERLCTAIMFREGYKNIMPYGRNYDNARDAESIIYQGNDESDKRIFFQYSLEKDWEGKLKRELKKVAEKQHEINTFVFVTSRNVTGYKRDVYKDIVKDQYGWEIRIFDREYLCFALTEKYPDLSQKYIGANIELFKKAFEMDSGIVIDQDKVGKDIYEAVLLKEYEYAISLLKRLENFDDPQITAYIGWLYYCLYNYDEALKYIIIADRKKPNDINVLGIKGCILAESGIKEEDKSKLIESRKIFIGLIEQDNQYQHLYNLGNVYSAMKDYKQAIEVYEKSIEYDSLNAMTWKNVGSVYHELAKYDKEIECIDKALEIEPELIEAIVCKAITVGYNFKDDETAVVLLNQASRINEDFVYRWPTLLYWVAVFNANLSELNIGFDSINHAIEIDPKNEKFRMLRLEILDELLINKMISKGKYAKYLLNELEHNFNKSVILIKIIEKVPQSIKNKKLLDCTWENYSANESKLNYDIRFTKKQLLYYLKYQDICLEYFNEASVGEIPFEHGIQLTEKEFYVYTFIVMVNFAETIHSVLSTNEVCKSQIVIAFKRLKKNYLTNLKTILAISFTTSPVFSTEKHSETLTEALMSIPDIFLREIIRQLNYIYMRCGFDPEEIFELVDESGEFDEWEMDFIEPILKAYNESTHIFPN